MLFDCELPQPLRPDLKALGSLRQDNQHKERAKAEGADHHFDISIPPPSSQSYSCIAKISAGALADVK
jgi:hypothetical protein